MTPKRVYNFSPGPAVLPLPVLEQAQQELLALPGLGISALEISHRSKWFDEVLAETEANLRQLLAIGDRYRIVFLQGGARHQFAMLPLNLLAGSQRSADYIVTGTWGRTALEEARRVGQARCAYDGEGTRYSRLPADHELSLDPQAAYVHFTSNETIQGTQFAREPGVGKGALVCDASSDFLSRPLPVDRYAMIYACAQKNAGPAGVTIVVVREDFLEAGGEHLPRILDYRCHIQEGSRLNTPPVFAVYLVLLVTRWLKDDIGGLARMDDLNRRKARMLYDCVDASGGFYAGHAQADCRSLMNVTFRLPSDDLQAEFLAQALSQGLAELKGHRSVGGIRASIYNAMPPAGVEALCDFMEEFRKAH